MSTDLLFDTSKADTAFEDIPIMLVFIDTHRKVEVQLSEVVYSFK